MPANLCDGNCGYTAISTAGTTTLNAGQASGLATAVGVFYGATCMVVGTTPTLNVYDVIPPQGAGTATTTNLLVTGTATTSNQAFSPITGVGHGVRYRGALVIVTGGTGSTHNVMWD